MEKITSRCKLLISLGSLKQGRQIGRGGAGGTEGGPGNIVLMVLRDVHIRNRLRDQFMDRRIILKGI